MKLSCLSRQLDLCIAVLNLIASKGSQEKFTFMNLPFRVTDPVALRKIEEGLNEEIKSLKKQIKEITEGW